VYKEKIKGLRELERWKRVIQYMMIDDKSSASSKRLNSVQSHRSIEGVKDEQFMGHLQKLNMNKKGQIKISERLRNSLDLFDL
jgi:hypothetical protein